MKGTLVILFLSLIVVAAVDDDFGGRSVTVRDILERGEGKRTVGEVCKPTSQTKFVNPPAKPSL